ncbi:MAG: leucine-rich repeat domain-containing protein [Clostridia bacterium]|nr:leucine-rich repeat domain-containing protein [Clostridia bacterium]
MKKLGLLFATVLMIMMFAFSASALEPTGQCGENVYWSFDESTGELVISGEGNIWDYECYLSPFTRENFETVVIKNGVTSIGEYVFYMSSMSDITIPDSVTTIGELAFYFCTKLANIDIPDSVTTIGDYNFNLCSSITHVNLGSGVTTIGESVFSNCSKLTSIIVDADNKFYSNDDKGVLFNKDKSVLVKYPEGNADTSYIIPNSVTSVEDYALYNCYSLTSITIPDGLTTIGESVFSNCSKLTSINIPSSVTTIGESVFSGCSKLTSIIVDADNKFYSNDDKGVLFNKDKSVLVKYPEGNADTSYTIPNSVTTIGNTAFSSNNLTNINIPNSVTTIGNSAFSFNNNLTNINIPDSVTTIGNGAFYNSHALTNIDIPDSVITIGASAFDNCYKLTNVTIGSGVTTIGNDAFRCGDALTNITVDADNTAYSSDSRGVLFNKNKTVLIQYPMGNIETSYTIPNSVITINDFAFPGCTNLVAVTIPGSVKTLGNGAFFYCTNLADIYYMGTKDTWKEVYIYPLNNDHFLDATIHFIHDKHSYSSQVTKQPTHLEQGEKLFTCACGDTYTEPIAKLTKHSYTSTIIKNPTCSEKGVEQLFCECGYSYNRDIKTTEHNYVDDVCIECGKSKVDNCSCNCHKSGFMGFIWKIILFFNKLFKTNKTCACGVAHY